jgi:hypothetical protein
VGPVQVCTEPRLLEAAVGQHLDGLVQVSPRRLQIPPVVGPGAEGEVAAAGLLGGTVMCGIFEGLVGPFGRLRPAPPKPGDVSQAVQGIGDDEAQLGASGFPGVGAAAGADTAENAASSLAGADSGAGAGSDAAFPVLHSPPLLY